MFSLISVVIFMMGVYLMNKMFLGFQPGKNRINSDVGRFRTSAGKWKGELIEWNEEEFELFSLNQKNLVTKRGFGRSSEGVVHSIYHEPMLYYYFKEYPATKKNAILFAQTARYEFVFRIRAKSSQIFLNEEFLGTLNHDGTLVQNNGKLLLGRIIRNDPHMKEIEIGGRVLGSVVLPQETPNVSPRAFDIDEKMNEEERILFMVLGIYEVITHLTLAKRSVA